MSDLAQIAISVAATLTIIGVIVITAAWLAERSRRRELERQRQAERAAHAANLAELQQEKTEYREQARNTATLAVAVTAERDRLLRELDNVKRVSQNRLYRESLEDHAFAGTQAALRIRAMQDELKVIAEILNVNGEGKTK